MGTVSAYGLAGISITDTHNGRDNAMRTLIVRGLLVIFPLFAAVPYLAWTIVRAAKS
jgi:hypothetical protein